MRPICCCCCCCCNCCCGVSGPAPGCAGYWPGWPPVPTLESVPSFDMPLLLPLDMPLLDMPIFDMPFDMPFDIDMPFATPNEFIMAELAQMGQRIYVDTVDTQAGAIRRGDNRE